MLTKSMRISRIESPNHKGSRHRDSQCQPLGLSTQYLFHTRVWLGAHGLVDGKPALQAGQGGTGLPGIGLLVQLRVNLALTE